MKTEMPPMPAALMYLFEELQQSRGEMAAGGLAFTVGSFTSHWCPTRDTHIRELEELRLEKNVWGSNPLLALGLEDKAYLHNTKT